MVSNLNNLFIGLIIFSIVACILIIYVIIRKKRTTGTELYIYLSSFLILLTGWLLYNKKRQHVLKLTSNIKKDFELVDYYDFKNCRLKLKDNFTYEIVSLEEGTIREGEWDFYGEDEIEMILIDNNILGLGKLRFK